MAAWKKTNEAWFGDTFDRNATLCYATTDGSNYATNIKGIDLSNSGDVTFTCDAFIPSEKTYTGYAVAKGQTGCHEVKICVDDIEVKGEFESITNKLHELQAQIDALKRRQMVTSELRSALKTLHYKREVE